MNPEQPDAALVDLLRQRISAVRERIDSAARAAGRDPAEVRLMLASKTQSLATVRAAVLAGGTLLGENKVQEVVAKAPGLGDLRPDLHLIGHLQSNKVNAVTPWVQCVQSIDTLALAERLSRRCAHLDRDLEVMVQVNVSGEESKSGVAPDDAVALATSVAALPRLTLTGFMTIGALGADDGAVAAGFALLRGLRDEVLASGAPGCDDARELSMGMTGDLDVAVQEGATIVRVGTAVFGARS